MIHQLIISDYNLLSLINMMKYDKELIDKLGIELFELWNECSVRCDKIDNLMKQLTEMKK